MNFGKVLTAMVTPFDRHGEIDFEKTSELIEYLLANGSDGLVVAGTTGESPTLTADEKVELWQHVTKVVAGRVPVIAGTGSNSTEASIKLSKRAESTGVDALMLVAPYYNKPNQKGLFEHFKTVAGAVNSPVMIYNVPGRSVVRLLPETIMELSEIENIVSLKEATGDLDGMAHIRSGTGDDFTIYSGDDNLMLPAYAIGADGIISVSSHVIGKEMQEMLTLFDQGKGKEAGKLHRKLLSVFNGMFSAPSPAPVKEALRMKGLDTGGVRLPLVPLTKSEQQVISECMQRLN
ncbi:dihydrodipicolinate synthase [Halobacillus karajensis]|uniref:4-hydroxy-tetrahydrodipicolinate synthase n=1 Tax=Halobacillus karajensis TaxID=195088 RepID=A0A024P2K4_9BACI|nr:4-hydroxy-tetrahydrodipicolinate synthase [Halobacillus karajensis]CDQ19691.1 4-hydroxy-tetrahydrodipicolinate synthase [Halobacillus karajensis]CDQ22151.1 4-hydroxy-tetrahydrodipicolinate synthase [Halobacillus karajensis]CDQ27992.1 4-hydroxy-tetrahydrodipicolinate synthase [Halobacillus karajensis]SEH73773.1 dihydrodipicolinate synthase [Halobacillus karajensis]